MGLGAMVGGFGDSGGLMGDPGAGLAGLSGQASPILRLSCSELGDEGLLLDSGPAPSLVGELPSCSLSLGLWRRLTVSDSFRLNSGTSRLLAAGLSGGSSTASALGGPGALGLCLMVRLPSSAKGMHSLELF